MRLRIKQYLQWLWFKWIAHDIRDGPPVLISLHYGPDGESLAAFINGRLVMEGPGLTMFLRIGETTGQVIEINDWDVDYQ